MLKCHFNQICDFRTYFFALIFLNMDISLNIEVKHMKSLTLVENIHMQGFMSQILD